MPYGELFGWKNKAFIKQHLISDESMNLYVRMFPFPLPALDLFCISGGILGEIFNSQMKQLHLVEEWNLPFKIWNTDSININCSIDFSNKSNLSAKVEYLFSPSFESAFILDFNSSIENLGIQFNFTLSRGKTLLFNFNMIFEDSNSMNRLNEVRANFNIVYHFHFWNAIRDAYKPRIWNRYDPYETISFNLKNQRFPAKLTIVLFGNLIGRWSLVDGISEEGFAIINLNVELPFTYFKSSILNFNIFFITLLDFISSFELINQKKLIPFFPFKYKCKICF